MEGMVRFERTNDTVAACSLSPLGYIPIKKPTSSMLAGSVFNLISQSNYATSSSSILKTSLIDKRWQSLNCFMDLMFIITCVSFILDFYLLHLFILWVSRVILEFYNAYIDL